jgi:hypothetical protein
MCENTQNNPKNNSQEIIRCGMISDNRVFWANLFHMDWKYEVAKEEPGERYEHTPFLRERLHKSTPVHVVHMSIQALPRFTKIYQDNDSEDYGESLVGKTWCPTFTEQDRVVKILRDGLQAYG